MWNGLNDDIRQLIPKRRLPDLIDKGSLTQRLVEASHGDFQVKVVYQGWQNPTSSECNCLSLNVKEDALIREVELWCKGEVWVLARSVIPKSALLGKLKHLEGLGSKPLGEILFNDPSLERTSFEIRCFNENQLQEEHQSNAVDSLSEEGAWGRRSVFKLQGEQVLVTEIFLPECPPLHTHT